MATFLKEKARVLKGMKEAKWNNKYMKIIEKPVKTIEGAKELKEITLNIAALMNSLHGIFQSSNFYKENRILSFLDRLLAVIATKFKSRLGLQQVLRQAASGKFDCTELNVAQSILCKFTDNFFLRSAGLSAKNEEAKMGQSFYR